MKTLKNEIVSYLHQIVAQQDILIEQNRIIVDFIQAANTHFPQVTAVLDNMVTNDGQAKVGLTSIMKASRFVRLIEDIGVELKKAKAMRK